MLATNDIPYCQAVAANLLQRWSAEPKITSALIKQLQNTNALAGLDGTGSHREM